MTPNLFGLVGILATLIVVLTLNWNRFRAMDPAALVRMVVIWTVVIAALFVLLRILGY